MKRQGPDAGVYGSLRDAAPPCDESSEPTIAIGGYFELELNQGIEYHSHAIRLNTGRNAFEYILRARGYKKVYLPYYTCDVMLEPIQKLGVACQFYHIDADLEPLFDVSTVRNGEAFVYTNYFGLKDACVERLARLCRNLIVDNAQSFFSKPIPGVDVFYSPRKFFGVPDGAYLYTDRRLQESLEQDRSDLRCEHLLLRVEYGAERGYPSYLRNGRALSGLAMRRMSSLTWRLLRNVDYGRVARTRRENYMTLHERLARLNKLELGLSSSQVPMVYPFYSGIAGLREQLISKRIYVAQYWPNVLVWTESGNLEHDVALHMVPLPVDQRYCTGDMEQVAAVIGGIVG